ncbi:MAG: hypothetical protein IPJ77_17455 [Planctomycetes bacterium]|nr:hypothetical protein [Planctomycetota bacterium]
MSTPRPKTLDELFDAEEARAWSGLQTSATAFAVDLRRATRVDRIVKEHPWCSVAAALAAGFAVAPLVSGALAKLVPLALRALRPGSDASAFVKGLVGGLRG